MKVIVSGCAGFIGSHTSRKLLQNSNNIVIGIDNMNDYYNVKQKEENLKNLQKYDNFIFVKEDIVNTRIIEKYKPDKVCHLAACAGVRYSIENPCLYSRVNIEGFINLLDQACKANVNTFVYASSSSVYGLEDKVPFKEDLKIDKCNSPYAVTKRCKELFADMYHRLYSDISIIGLRFFTVYGPCGRPDMAPYKFLDSIINNKEIEQFGNGSSERDYTYVEDIVEGVVAALENKKKIQCEVINLGNSKPITLKKFIDTCEKVSNQKANIKVIENQKGDVPVTFADTEKAKRLLDYNPNTDIEIGLRKTFDWLKQI